jgi:hypothetical protein
LSLRSTARAAGAGRLFYQVWHRPIAWARRMARDGGPIEQWRTAAGARAMESAASELPPPTSGAGRPLELHVLTGRRFWFQTAFCLHSLATRSGRPLLPSIYDDGSLGPTEREHLTRIFPGVRFTAREETVVRLDRLLPAAQYPFLRERWERYPNIRKLTDPHAGSSGWKLVLDSDLLFYHPPGLLVEWLDAPDRPLHAIDAEKSYGYSDSLLARLASAPLHPRLNVGLCGLKSEELDWERIEYLCRELITAERTHYYLEQALVAVLLAGRECAIAPADDYVTLPRPPEADACRAVMHHYVAEAHRVYFQRNWRKCFPGGSPR